MAGVPLSAEGLAQADAVARGIGPLTAVHSSPRERARQTAATIAAAAGTPVETVAELDEIDFGTWAGRSFADLDDDPAWSRWNRARATSTPPDGESMVAAQARAVAHVDRVVRSGGTVALVSHCDIIRAIVAHVLGLSLDRILSFDIDPASVTTLVAGDWGARVAGLNRRAA